MAKDIFTKSDNFKSEYSCAVVTVPTLTPIEGSDFLAKTDIFGTQIVVRKDQVHEGDIMIYAANETQLNEKFLSVNNLYEIGCREKNANASEVNEIYAPYIPIKEKADSLRNDAKNVKSSIDSLTTKSAKLKKQIKKKEKELSTLDKSSEDYVIKEHEIKEMTEKSDSLIEKALSKTTVYTNLKKQVEETVNSGSDIISEVKKHCGYMNKYGRVRCIKLKDTPSFGVLFPPSELIKYDESITMEDIEAYLGNEFDTVNGDLFVKAYVPPIPESMKKAPRANKAQKHIKRFDRMIDGEFFFHYDTGQLQKDIQYLKPDDIVDISVKKHGTSICIGKLHVNQPIKLPFFKRVINKFIDCTKLFKKFRFTDSEVVYGPVFSSRTVIKNRYINQGVSDGYYGQDIWTEYGDIIYPYLDEGMTVYGEICGYLSGSDKMIQKCYDYGCKKGENNIMFYRITTTNEDGSKREWEVTEVREWTETLINMMKSVDDPNCSRITPIDILYHGTLDDLYPELDTENHWHSSVLEMMKNDKEHFGMEENEPLCTNFESPREGIVLRKVGDSIPRADKLKCMSFLFGESIRMTDGDVDVEMADNYGNL